MRYRCGPGLVPCESGRFFRSKFFSEIRNKKMDENRNTVKFENVQWRNSVVC